MTWALCGYQTFYNRVVLHYGQYKMILLGAFDRTLRSGARVDLVVDHDEDQCLGSTLDIMELYSHASVGLAFRAKLPNTELGRYARSMALDKHDGASVGFDYKNARKEVRRMNGVDVNCIFDAVLYECSYQHGQGSGAVKEAHVICKDVDYSRTLKEQCESGQLLYDGAAVGFTRSLQKLLNKQ